MQISRPAAGLCAALVLATGLSLGSATPADAAPARLHAAERTAAPAAALVVPVHAPARKAKRRAHRRHHLHHPHVHRVYRPGPVVIVRPLRPRPIYRPLPRIIIYR